MTEISVPCVSGHTWTRIRASVSVAEVGGDTWTPERGTPCDCGKKLWGIPLQQAREHDWEFYANGSFCRRCGVRIGSGVPCR